MNDTLYRPAFVYTRESTAQQLTGGGFDRQREACEAFCNLKGWTPVRTFREQESGSVEAANRPLLAEALALCASPRIGISIIVVERADRIARDLIVGELFFTECRKLGVQVYAADSGQELVNAEGDPTRKLIRQVLGAFSEWSKNEIVAKLQAGRRRTKERTGKPCGGPLPYGERGIEVEMDAVREIMRRYRLGQSGVTIARCLNYPANAHFLKPGKAKYWASSTVALIITRWRNRPDPSNNLT